MINREPFPQGRRVLEREKAALLPSALMARPRRRGLTVYTDVVDGDLYRYYPPNAGKGDGVD